MTETSIPLRRPMEPFDTFMYRSEADPHSRSTLMGLFILDRPPDWDRLVEAYERITRLVVPLRQRVVEPLVPVTCRCGSSTRTSTSRTTSDGPACRRRAPCDSCSSSSNP